MLSITVSSRFDESTTNAYPPKINFFGRPYFGPYGPMGCCPFKFLHMLDNGKGLLTHTSSGTEVPPTISNNEN